MKKHKLSIFLGWICLLIALGSFLLQIGSLYVQQKYQLEYIDHRLFYIINIVCLIFILLALFLFVSFKKSWIISMSCFVLLFTIIHLLFMQNDQKEIRNVTSISPDRNHVFSIKHNISTGESVYYRSRYKILGQAKETLPDLIQSDLKIDWLVNDVAAVTYQASNGSTQQFVATFGDRGDGMSYYYVGAEIHGRWQSDQLEVRSSSDGILIKQGTKEALFNWENIEQFGTLALVLSKNGEAKWTIALDENFQKSSDTATMAPSGNIILSKAVLTNNQPVKLSFVKE